MNKKIRTSKLSKVVACYLVLMIFLQIAQPMVTYALSSGPTQPEFNSFTPISTSEMVDLSSGDFNYNIPVMDVGGYPLNLSYKSGVTMDEEASWVGLGWNLNVGQIERQVRGMPDDFRGDEIKYENNVKDNITVGTNFNYHTSVFGFDFIGVGMGIGVQYNNYEGITFKPSFGVSFDISDNVSVGADFSSSVGEGASVSPSVSISKKYNKMECSYTSIGAGFGVDYNSRKGLERFTISAIHKDVSLNSKANNAGTKSIDYKDTNSKEVSGGISLNNLTYTPTKRVAYDNNSFTFNATLGSEIFGAEAQGRITGYGSYQKINSAYKNRNIKAYGFDNTEYKGGNEGVMDFNREKEQASVSKHTTALPVTNYAYDLYSIDGQGVSGMFRPYRSQSSYVYNDRVLDNGIGLSAGAEFGVGNLAHGGINFLASPSTSWTGKWISKNNALPLFEESYTDANKLKYETTTLKMIGELNVDREKSLYFDQYHSNSAERLKLKKSRYNNKTEPIFQVKNTNNIDDPYSNFPIAEKLKRKQRFTRNQNIQKVSDKEAINDPFITRSSYAKPHHTAGLKVLQADGKTYVYGKPVYNTKKVECTFDVSGKSGNANYSTDIVSNINGVSGNNSNNSNKYFNKVTTPSYAHSFLITSVLSNDYEDIDNNGPTINDLGSFTKFEYETKVDKHKWRVPFIGNTASFNEGLKSHTDDETGNYLYGEKELVYIKRIITKTHVAIFTLSERADTKSATGEIGNNAASPTTYSYKLDKIDLYSYNDASKANLLDDIPENDLACTPIKTAHFDYSYDLCKKIPSSTTYSPGSGDINRNRGKLTLKKVYFTYKNSNMGKYTPYVFDYDEGVDKLNPDYNIKGNDIWGNYSPNDVTATKDINSPLNNAEYPFTKQDKSLADEYTAAWTLKRIQLPSGGEITIKTESDDYKYVENKKAMQMYKVSGVGDTRENASSGELTNNVLYSGNDHAKFVYVNLGPTGISSVDEIKNKYFKENYNKPIYFRFLMNMVSGSSWQYDYVSGYFKIDKTTSDIGLSEYDGNTYISIPMKFLKRDGGTGGNRMVSPIVKAGWGFGRAYLNRVVYSLGGNSSNTTFVSIVQDLVGSIQTISELWKGPNKALQDKGCARVFVPNKSWIRLENPSGRKFGGGLRVKSIELSDNWNAMTGSSNPLYDQKYGQDYNYSLEDGTSSGVATYEPNGSAENALVEPFCPNEDKYADKIAAPKDQNYVEKPFGENFYPSPKITYSKVTVSNLKRKNEDGAIVGKHATGKVVTEFYTSYDFPTLADYTDLDMAYNKANPVLSFLNILSVDHLVASQGYTIETNDMDGKTKSEKVYGEGQTLPISSVEYKYNIGPDGKLDNQLTTIDSNGRIEQNLLGVDYDMITDFNESNSQSFSVGFDGNLAAFLVAIFPSFVPTILPKAAYHENILRTAVTTKVIHRTGILKEKIAYDLGSRVSMENIAWDSNSGQVLVTKTNNEFDDAYYTLSYPAYWAYDGMGLASNNIGVKGRIKRTNQCAVDPRPYFQVINPQNTSSNLDGLDTIFHAGDELMLDDAGSFMRVWVIGFDSEKNGLLLMDKDGKYIDDCGHNQKGYKFTIVRSGYRNLQQATMASITLMANPIDIDDDRHIDEQLLNFDYPKSDYNPKVINASAVEYKEFWKPQNEGLSTVYPTLEGGDPSTELEIMHPYEIGYNPYLWNVKGDWRAEKSYAYLTGRNSQGASTRHKGFYNKFKSFYNYDREGWQKNLTDVSWTYASSVTQFSPYGNELENADALQRFSSAQYGYNNNLPMAVASNSRYREMGFEGFEERADENALRKHFGFTRKDNSPIGIVSEFSHTGKNSVSLAPKSPVRIKRKLSPQINNAPVRACDNLSCGTLIESISLDDETDFESSVNVVCNNPAVPLEYHRDYLVTANCGLIISGISAPSFDTDYNINTGGYEFIAVPGHTDRIIIRIYGYELIAGIINLGMACRPTYQIPINVGGYTVHLCNANTIIRRGVPLSQGGHDVDCFTNAEDQPEDIFCCFKAQGHLECGECPERIEECPIFTHF